eukprot:jgi/Picsp_1/5693/NSC_03052-R1_---NA---
MESDKCTCSQTKRGKIGCRQDRGFGTDSNSGKDPTHYRSDMYRLRLLNLALEPEQVTCHVFSKPHFSSLPYMARRSCSTQFYTRAVDGLLMCQSSVLRNGVASVAFVVITSDKLSGAGHYGPVVVQ